MRSGGGHAKGSAFERQVSQDLSKWVSAGKRDDIFWRSAGSGARATVAADKGKKIAGEGDIIAIRPEGSLLVDRFVIECKHYKSLDIQQAIFKTGGVLPVFWRKLVSASTYAGKEPMLIAQQNYLPPFVLLGAFWEDIWDGKSRVLFSIYQKGWPTAHAFLFSDLLDCKWKKTKVKKVKSPRVSISQAVRQDMNDASA